MFVDVDFSSCSGRWGTRSGTVVGYAISVRGQVKCFRPTEHHEFALSHVGSYYSKDSYEVISKASLARLGRDRRIRPPLFS